MGSRPAFVACASAVYVPFSVNVFVPNPDRSESLHYFSAVLNSRLMWKWFQHYAKRRGAGLEINGNVLRRAPIVEIDGASTVMRELHDKIANQAKELLSLQLRARSSTLPHERTVIERQIAATHAEIDRLVYELYGLSDDEIRLVEEATQ